MTRTHARAPHASHRSTARNVGSVVSGRVSVAAFMVPSQHTGRSPCIFFRQWHNLGGAIQELAVLHPKIGW